MSPIKNSVWPGIRSVPSCIIMWVKAWKKASSPKLEKILQRWRRTMKRCGRKCGLLVFYERLCRAIVTCPSIACIPKWQPKFLQSNNAFQKDQMRSFFLKKNWTMPGGHRDCWRWRRRGRLWRWILSSYADLFAPALSHCWVRPAKLLHELAIWDWWGEPKRAAFQQLFFFTCSDGTIRDLCFFNVSGLFLHKGFDVCYLLCSSWFLNGSNI